MTRENQKFLTDFIIASQEQAHNLGKNESGLDILSDIADAQKHGISAREYFGLSAEELAWQMVRELPNANPLPLILGEALANFVIFLIAGALISAFGGNWPSF
ncbi:hypothetical protein GHI93_07635 [Lactococcus hircilactis]|uniref:Uncharacterized protein n=1 Tax=Lactococcus hircilactis TaxID=1494462 RepID=A0A7X1Z8J3_9LACT|nr:hypothetical protein [Lactococcus hircilactis]MQW39793.1 hypothetical protein [Lactococcus hircilactis]